MNVISSSYYAAVRKHGVCQGTLWCQPESKVGASPSSKKKTATTTKGTTTTTTTTTTLGSSTICDYCVLAGSRLDCYESRSAYYRGDTATAVLHVVGASAVSSEDAFCLVVTDQGTHMHCQATSKRCRNVWLAAFQAGLALLLLLPSPNDVSSSSTSGNSQPRFLPPGPQTTIRRGLLGAPKRYCKSCGAVEGCVTTTSPTSGNSSALHAAASRSSSSSSSTTTANHNKPIGAAVAAVSQYVGMEGRVDLCHDCETAQGLLEHVEFYKICLQSAQQEQAALQQALEKIHSVVLGTVVTSSEAEVVTNTAEPESAAAAKGGATTTEELQPGDDSKKQGTDSEEATTKQQPQPEKQHEDTDKKGSDSSSPDHSSESWSHVGSDSTNADNTSWQAVDPSSPPPQSSSSWIHLPPAAAVSTELLQLLQDPVHFGPLRQLSPLLDDLVQELLAGAMRVGDFLEQLAAAASPLAELSVAAALKKQAFRVAGDMGSAMKLLLDSSGVLSEQQHPENDNKTAVLQCVLDFLLELCAEDELQTVAFFWPQLCHIHLRMLPPEHAAAVARVELMEDFLLTVCRRYSIHLALQLIWTHTADLEESLLTTMTASVPCRRRRFAVCRFVCELESLLFEFEDGWGGGSVSLGRLLSPTGHQVQLLKEQMQQIQALRRAQPLRLVRSARLELLSSSQQQQERTPEEAAQEKLRIAKNADYFLCHLNFSRRLADIAERLHHMDQSVRAGALEEELNLLNASGAMGGDPLNTVREHLVRVVRVPSTEGHVFRSKERTPVLLLMEVVDEGAEVTPVESPLGEEPAASFESTEDSTDHVTKAEDESEGDTVEAGAAEHTDTVHDAAHPEGLVEAEASEPAHSVDDAPCPEGASEANETRHPSPPPGGEVLEGASDHLLSSPKRKSLVFVRGDI